MNPPPNNEPPRQYIHVLYLPGLLGWFFGYAITNFARLIDHPYYCNLMAVCGWVIVAVGCVLMGIVAWETRRLKRRLATGLCPACGYDLRATPDCCPECGRVPDTHAPDRVKLDRQKSS